MIPIKLCIISILTVSGMWSISDEAENISDEAENWTSGRSFANHASSKMPTNSGTKIRHEKPTQRCHMGRGRKTLSMRCV